MKTMETIYVVAAALVAEDGRVLLQQRPKGSSLADLWEFPGGKLEPGETPEAALVREIREELGVALEADALIPTGFTTVSGDGRSLILLLYRTTIWSGEPLPLHATALRWEKPEAMHQLAMPPADYPLADTLALVLGA